MKVGVPKETADGERRVGLVPEAVEKLRDRGIEMRVESGAGHDFYVDRAYSEAGAEVVDDRDALWGGSDLVAKVLPPSPEEIDLAREGLATVSLLPGVQRAELVRRLAERGVTAISMDAIPRIARAQSMDALSSMGSIGGYKSVLIGANALGRYLPMMTTAAGTIKAARVLVLGAGVAGLQAIATARRLGAQVTAFDIRPEVKEQIESLGATFLERRQDPSEAETRQQAAEAAEPAPARGGVAGAVDWLKDVFEVGRGRDGASEDTAAQREGSDDDGDDPSDSGGYAREQPEEKQRRDRAMIHEHLRDIDLVITTALIPGKPAPVLLTAEMVEAMRPGSVVVDLAAEAGGNCELTRPGEVIEHRLVHVHGPANLPSEMPIDASRLYSRNVVSLLSLLVDDGELRLAFDDEVIDAICLTHAGEIRSDVVRQALDESPTAGAPGEAGRG